MPVIIKYAVERNGEKKITFTSRTEADSYDKMLEMDNGLFKLLGKSNVVTNADLNVKDLQCSWFKTKKIYFVRWILSVNPQQNRQKRKRRTLKMMMFKLPKISKFFFIQSSTLPPLLIYTSICCR
nr:YebG family protein [Candidatus Enterovibrio escacola]